MIDINKVTEIAERHLAGSDMFVVECKATPMGEIELLIDSDTAVKLEDCAALNRAIEAELDRVRRIHWGPRTIDLDIIFYGDLVLNDPDLIIPHADYRKRDFVLIPLREIVPDYADPATGKTVLEYAKELGK